MLEQLDPNNVSRLLTVSLKPYIIDKSGTLGEVQVTKISTQSRFSLKYCMQLVVAIFSEMMES